MSLDTKIRELQLLHAGIGKEVMKRLAGFSMLWQKSTDREIFAELAFCLLTPQSSALRCWRAVELLQEHDLLFRGSKENIAAILNIVRFKNKKAEYICRARKLFNKDGVCTIKSMLEMLSSAFEMREWLVASVKGMGLKEASHFLRNTGFGNNIAILDRHILRNLVQFRVIEKIPAAISRRNYLSIEVKMRDFAERVCIPFDHLDFVLWYKETGIIFK